MVALVALLDVTLVLLADAAVENENDYFFGFFSVDTNPTVPVPVTVPG